MHDEDIFEAEEVMDESNIYEWGGLSVVWYIWYYIVLYNSVHEDSNYTDRLILIPLLPQTTPNLPSLVKNWFIQSHLILQQHHNTINVPLVLPFIVRMTFLGMPIIVHTHIYAVHVFKVKRVDRGRVRTYGWGDMIVYTKVTAMSFRCAIKFQFGIQEPIHKLFPYLLVQSIAYPIPTTTPPCPWRMGFGCHYATRSLTWRGQ